MSDQGFQILALLVYFAVMIGIGYYAYRRTSNHEDYMLGGRDLPAWTAALSAGASDMSGWLMMGLPGAIYAAGLIEAWIAIGLTVGAYFNWRLVAPRLRAYTEVAANSITVPSFFENRLRDSSRALRVASGAILLVFFTFYVSSMMVAGGEFWVLAFDGEYLVGMLVVAGVTLAYTLFGGFLAASLTDVVQGVMMLLALLIVPVIAMVSVGGPTRTFAAIREVDPSRLSLFGGEFSTVTLIGVISAAAWGLGYFGQPHIIVRFMAMRSPASARPARWIGISWMAVSLAGAVVCGLIGVAFFQVNPQYDLANPEHVVLALSQLLLHPLVVGFVFAAVLAAIMSTVSSQLIVSSSAFVEDLYHVIVKNPGPRTLVHLGRGCVLLVAVVAILLALDPGETILNLVAFAWAGFGASFGPAVLLCLFWRRLSNWGALAGMVSGALTVFLWKEFGPAIMGVQLYEIIPGFIINIAVAVVVSRFTFRDDPQIAEEFDAALAMAHGKVAGRV